MVRHHKHYDLVELSIKKVTYVDKGEKKTKFELVGLDDLDSFQSNGLTNQNAIYIYRGSKSKKVYIGQTVHFLERHNQHYDGNEEKFNVADFNQVIVVFSEFFNRSALDDVESQLITYFNADIPSARSSRVSFEDEVINRTSGNSVNEYKERADVASYVILPLWEKELYPRGWVQTKTLEDLRSKELVKYSPIKQLTPEQGVLISKILHNPTKNYVIVGDAGTGKTVLLTHLVANFLKEKKDCRIGVVVQPNWKAIGERIFKVFGMNSSNLTITTSTSLINEKKKFDVIIVDESHKLSRQYTKQDNSFNAVYDIPEFSNCKSHLEIIKKLGNQIILMYDVLQGIRPANVTREDFAKLTRDFEKEYLKTQFRIRTPEGKNYTSDDYVNGIKYLLYKDTGLLDKDPAQKDDDIIHTSFDPNFNRDVFRDKNMLKNPYFGYVVGKPLEQLFKWVYHINQYNKESTNRVLSGMFCCDTVDVWKQSDGKDPNITHFHEDGVDYRWNSTQENWINIQDDDAEEQIGSVFAVQGIDLNYVGVMIGPDIKVNEEGKLEGVPDHHNNVNNKFTKKEMQEPDNRREFTLFILNQYYVLLTRGIDGIRLGFWENDAFRKYMEETLEINA